MGLKIQNNFLIRALGNPLASLKWVSENYFIFLYPQFHFFQIAFVRGWSKLGLEWRSVEKKGLENYTYFARNRDHVHNSQIGIQIWFHLWKWRIYFFKNHFHSGLTRIIPKTIRIWSKRAKDCLNVTSAREPTCISQMGEKKLFFIFKPMIPLLLNSLHSGLVKLGPKMNRSRENGAQELHVFARNWHHRYNTQMGIQIWFHICKWKILLFKNHLHSGLSRMNPKTIQI